MSRPLPQGDPVRLGPFTLTARLSQTPAGITYLGMDQAGRRVCVAVMTQGAAADAAARDRFRAAIVGVDPGDPVPVLAAEPDGPAPWVATAYDPGHPGAERFLASVLLQDTAGRGPGEDGSGPQFLPHWIGSGQPAVGADQPTPTEGPAKSGRGPAEVVIALAALLGVGLLLFSLLYACEGTGSPDSPSTGPAPQTSQHSTSTPTLTPPTPNTTGTHSPTGDPGGSAA